MREYDVIGHSCTKPDSYDKVTGKAVYVGDRHIKGMLYAKLLRSPVAHGIITSINTEKAKEIPGVYGVFTYEDVPDIPFTTCGHPRPFDTPLDSFILSRHVRFVGDPIAAVAAKTPEIAEKAVKLIEFTYEELHPVFGIDEAVKKGTIEIHEGSHNIAGENKFEIGNVDEAFSKAAYVFEDVLETPIVTHSPMETHISLSEWDEGNKRMTVYVANQVPTIIRERIAYALGLRLGQIRVIKGVVGGGFGGKQEPVFEQINCFLTYKLKRPVLLESTREECLTTTRTRHSSKIIIKTALDENYKFIGRDVLILNNTGAYSSHGHNVAMNMETQACVMYPCPNIRVEAKTIYTNILIAGAMRGYGIPQWTFAMESHIDNMARKLNISPIKFRLDTMYKVGMPINVENVNIYTDGLEEIIKQGMERIGWNEFNSETGSSTIKRGVGMACSCYGQSCYPHSVELSGARVTVNEDASIVLSIGCADVGQGADTVMSQIAAEAIGIPFDWVRLTPVDTDISPFDPGAYASRQTYVTGMAVKKAAIACKNDILQFASEMFSTDVEELDIKKGILINTVTNAQIAPIEDVTWKMYYSHPVAKLISHEEYNYPTDNVMSFGASFAIVNVDTETGMVEVEKLLTYLDSGKVLNPLMAKGQIYGGGVMSYGYGLMEQLLLNPKTGKVYNDNLLDYKVPTMADYPDMEGYFVETDEPTSAYGNKSMGEPPNLAPAAAIRNAVVNATGVEMNRLPLTPERVWTFLNPEEGENIV